MIINPCTRWALAVLISASATMAQSSEGHPDTQEDWFKASEIVQTVQPPAFSDLIGRRWWTDKTIGKGG